MRPAKTDTTRYVLSMGESKVVSESGQIICFGLGSCIGVFLYDKFKCIGAGAHIMLPDRPDSQNNLIDNLIQEMLNVGCNALTIRARLVGGADVMKMKSFQIGRKNIDYIRKKLSSNKIMIQAMEVGGSKHRTARMDIQSGTLWVNSGRKYITI
ncbi:chemotaxis protein CheD [Fulvivirga sp. 29W222]|uniref:Probable chemoreceptor glutamine deamidase CheD n=1 Tax=Fulvivirga marina TaxID=2494733 RepID=A0A937FZ24_9BACT|nr:chemotaxis protein CheD [Fulvivirga marina]MBL6447111.1 chemotaxis protein CheD [Fulvivirga marina]